MIEGHLHRAEMGCRLKTPHWRFREGIGVCSDSKNLKKLDTAELEVDYREIRGIDYL